MIGEVILIGTTMHPAMPLLTGKKPLYREVSNLRRNQIK
jgi:hypothetical protein